MTAKVKILIIVTSENIEASESIWKPTIVAEMVENMPVPSMPRESSPA